MEKLLTWWKTEEKNGKIVHKILVKNIITWLNNFRRKAIKESDIKELTNSVGTKIVQFSARIKGI